MNIDFFTDTVCILSYIEKRRLEKAMAAFPDIVFNITAHPLPVFPAERTQGIRNRIEPLLTETGIEVRFDRLPDVRSPFLSHILVRHAFAAGKGMKTLESVFKAFFTDGRDIGELSVLLDICRENDIDEEAFLHDAERRDALPAFFRPERLRCVPAFLFDGKLLISGAQSTDVLIKMIQTAALSERERLTSGSF